MKKFTGLFLSILMILSVCTVSVSADDSPISGSVAASDSNKMFNNLSDTIWKFDNVKQDVTEENSTTAIIDGSTKNQEVKYHMGGYYREAQSFLNTTDSKVTYDTAGNAMKIDIKRGYYAVLNGDNVLNNTQGATTTQGGDVVYLKSYMGSSSYDAVNVRFTMKAAATSGRAAFSLRGTANGSNVTNHYEIVALDTGKILLCGVEVASYTTDQWYTFDVRVNMKEHYARLYLTSGRDGELMNGRTTANTVFFDSCFDDLRATNSSNYTSLTITDVTQIMMSFATTPTATWYMGEWYQNAMTSAPRPTYESLNSDFSGEQAELLEDANSKTPTVGRYQKMWTSGHADSLAFVRDGVAEVKCNASGAPARISRYPFRNNTAPERRHRIDVSVGGEKGSSVAFDFGNTVYPLCKLTSNTNMRLASGELTGNGAELDTNYTDASVAMSAGEKTPLRVKIFYDESTRSGVVGVASGTNFTCSNFSVPTSMTAAFMGVSLYAPKGTANATAYYDDFTWDITPSEVTVEEVAKIDYSNDAQANLDETVTFTYSETLRETEAAVIVEANDETANPSYTLSYDDNKLLVHFAGLSPNTSYTVTAPTMTTLSGLTTGGLSQSKTFITVNSTYSATKPSLSDGAVSSTLSVPYAAAKSATLLVAVYNSDGSLNKVTSVAKTIARDGDGTLSINLPTVPTNGSWKAFVWDGLTNLKPLSEVGESNS